ncbi:MAG: hypothetical protein WCV84_02700 [Patescibacteria group bacterium]
MSSRIFVLTGPSGAGKSSVLDRLLANPPVPFVRFVTTTSRQPRLGEVNGKDYWFLTPELFEKEIAEDNFLEWGEFYGHKYGSSKLELARVLAQQKPILITLDVQGARDLKQLRPDTCIIFIDAPRTDLMQRTSKRAFQEAEAARRTARLEMEESFRASADVVVVNKDGALDETVERVAEEIRQRVAHE